MPQRCVRARHLYDKHQLRCDIRVEHQFNFHRGSQHYFFIFVIESWVYPVSCMAEVIKNGSNAHQVVVHDGVFFVHSGMWRRVFATNMGESKQRKRKKRRHCQS
jgi:hypothetical protein